VATPAILPPGGVYTGSVTVTISCVTPDATILHALGSSGTISATNFLPYAGPIELTHSGPVRAKAYKLGMVESLTATASYD
jgi:hypothetical protein